jgi:KaiC/GvpD/RAD55 family RecA-like ATPase
VAVLAITSSWSKALQRLKKTVLGMEFIYRGFTKFDEPGIIVVFKTVPQKVICGAAIFGWNFPSIARLAPDALRIYKVQDSSSGMTEATLDRIFDPLFKTKFSGRG